MTTNLFELLSALLTLAALFSYINYRFIKLPDSIGVMFIALVGSLALIFLHAFGINIRPFAERVVRGIDFSQTLLQGMLSFLLFAGALQLNLNDLLRQKWVITALSVFGVVISTFVFGTLIYGVSNWLQLGLGFDWCLLFGALISPTDPVAVLGILSSAKAPKTLEIQIAGESLFNDGIGVVAFIILSEIAVHNGNPSIGHIAALFVEQALGGAVLGIALGWITFRLLKSVDNYQLEILLTLALVTGGYSLAANLHTSGPIAIVCAGLFIGNHGRAFAMSAKTRGHLDAFWELIDSILNAVLFVLIGFEVLMVSFMQTPLLAGLVAIPLIILSRYLSVAIPVFCMRPWQKFVPGTLEILTWGGLRGGISVALALSLPLGPQRDTIVVITYVLVVFSILVQGLTIKPVVMRFASMIEQESARAGLKTT